MTAKSLTRKPRARVIRTAKTGTASEAIGELTPNCEIFVLTFGLALTAEPRPMRFLPSARLLKPSTGPRA